MSDPAVFPDPAPWTEEQLAGFARGLDEAMAKPGGQRYLHRNGNVSRRLPLPLGTRLRLRLERGVNCVAAWLSWHGHPKAALRIWRACGMMKGAR